MKNIEWWRSTSQHMWRTFFILKRRQEEAGKDNPISICATEKRVYEICGKVFDNSFVKSDQEILKMYFTSRWGDDLYAVEDYSLKHNVPVNVIWIVIKRACREVMEEIGLLEKKNDTQEE